MSKMEEWRDIDIFEGLFKISNLGRIKKVGNTVTRSDGVTIKYPVRMLKSHLTKDGYERIRLTSGSDGKNCLIHRLVAQAFLNNNDNKPEVHHKDENKQNNKVDNLEWVTHKENTDYSNWCYTKMQEINKKSVYCITSEEERYEFDSIKDFAIFFNVKIPSAHSLFQKGTRKSGRFAKWRFYYE